MPSTKTSAIIAKENPELAQATQLFDARWIVGIFVIVFLEICTPLCILFPTDAIIFVAGLLYGAWGFPGGLFVLILVLLIPVVLGNLFGYWYGEKLWDKLTTLEDTRYFKKEYLTVGRHYFDDYGNKAFYIATFLPIRSIIPPIAGVLKRPWTQFVLHTTLAGLCRLVPLVSISYAITAYVPPARDYIPLITMIVVVVPQVIVAWKLLLPAFRKYKERITEASVQISTIVTEIKDIGSQVAAVTSAVIHDKPIDYIVPKAKELPKFTQILVGASQCLMNMSNIVDIGSYSLQKDFADTIVNLGLPVIVVTNADGEKLIKLSELLHPYITQSDLTKNRQICSYAHNPSKNDPQYFANVIAYYHLDPISTIYIDYTQINLNAAKTNNITTLLYVEPKTTTQVLQKMINPLTPVVIAPTKLVEDKKAEIVVASNGQPLNFIIPKTNESGYSAWSLFNPNSTLHTILSDFTFVMCGLWCAIHTDVSHTKEACIVNTSLVNFCTSMNSRVIVTTDEVGDMYNLVVSLMAPYWREIFTLSRNPLRTKIIFREQLIVTHKLNPLKIILVDTNIQVLTVAQSVGIGHSILYTEYEAFVEQVQTLMRFEEEKLNAQSIMDNIPWTIPEVSWVIQNVPWIPNNV